jgi:hypothetical protein
MPRLDRVAGWVASRRMNRDVRRSDAREGIVWIVSIMSVAALATCGGSGAASKHPSSGSAGNATGASNAAQLAEAKRLLDPNNQPQVPTADQVACVAQVVVQNPTADQIANDMAQIPNKDLRQLVMTDYLHCAYNYVLDLYMRFAPADLNPSALKCIRSKFTELDINRLSEVIVDDPDAGYTGPLVIQACQSGSPSNPLKNGTIPNMGGS